MTPIGFPSDGVDFDIILAVKGVDDVVCSAIIVETEL